MPDDLDELHAWILTKDRRFRLLTRYLWKKASPDVKAAARKLIEEFIRIRFAKYYVAGEGAFSLYPDAGHADLDGTGEAIGMYAYIGALSREKQKRLWGDPAESVVDLGRHRVSEIRGGDIDRISKHPEVNSVRIFEAYPTGNFLENVEGVFYPRNTRVLDLADLLPRVQEWLATTPQNMGNWVTKERIHQMLAGLNVELVPVLEGNLYERFNEFLRRGSRLVLIGFDVLQRPRYRIVYEHAGDA